MIKRKRKANKQALISVRAYTVVGNSTGDCASGVTHYFPMGTRVVLDSSSPLGNVYSGRGRWLGRTITQFVEPKHLI